MVGRLVRTVMQRQFLPQIRSLGIAAAPLREAASLPGGQRDHEAHQRGNAEVAEVAEPMTIAKKEENVVP